MKKFDISNIILIFKYKIIRIFYLPSAFTGKLPLLLSLQTPMANTERPGLQIRDLLFRINYSAYSFTVLFSPSNFHLSLFVSKENKKENFTQHQSVLLLWIIQIFSLASCFDRHCQPYRLSFTHDDVVRLAATSPCLYMSFFYSI